MRMGTIWTTGVDVAARDAHEIARSTDPHKYTPCVQVREVRWCHHGRTGRSSGKGSPGVVPVSVGVVMLGPVSGSSVNV